MSNMYRILIMFRILINCVRNYFVVSNFVSCLIMFHYLIRVVSYLCRVLNSHLSYFILYFIFTFSVIFCVGPKAYSLAQSRPISNPFCRPGPSPICPQTQPNSNPLWGPIHANRPAKPRPNGSNTSWLFSLAHTRCTIVRPRHRSAINKQAGLVAFLTLAYTG